MALHLDLFLAGLLLVAAAGSVAWRWSTARDPAPTAALAGAAVVLVVAADYPWWPASVAIAATIVLVATRRWRGVGGDRPGGRAVRGALVAVLATAAGASFGAYLTVPDTEGPVVATTVLGGTALWWALTRWVTGANAAGAAAVAAAAVLASAVAEGSPGPLPASTPAALVTWGAAGAVVGSVLAWWQLTSGRARPPR